MKALKRKTRLRVGQDVKVFFLDHAESDAVSNCIVVGTIVKVERCYIIVRCWETLEDDNAINQTDFAILRSTISDLKVLVPKE